jgi:hypothetical protein
MVSIAESHPDLLDKWHPTKNLPLTPNDVSKGSHKRVWWICENGHEWQTMVYGVFGCPKCSNRKPPAELKNSDISLFWNLGKNKIPITDAYINDPIYYSWQCDNGHEWKNKIRNQLYKKNNCTQCYRENSSRKIKKFPKAKSKFDYITRYWDKTNSIPINNIDQYETARWECYRCNTIWLATKYQMLNNHIQVFHECNKPIRYLFTEHPELIKEWSVKNIGIAKESVRVGSSIKFWWKCNKCNNDWFTTASNRHKGLGCPICARSGYRESRAGVLYFLYHKELNSFKVGITNIKEDRLRRFQTLGWDCVLKITSSNGSQIRKIETNLFRWIRVEKEIPKHLTYREFGYIGGFSETFSAELITQKEVISKIEELCVNLAEDVGTDPTPELPLLTV